MPRFHILLQNTCAIEHRVFWSSRAMVLIALPCNRCALQAHRGGPILRRHGLGQRVVPARWRRRRQPNRLPRARRLASGRLQRHRQVLHRGDQRGARRPLGVGGGPRHPHPLLLPEPGIAGLIVLGCFEGDGGLGGSVQRRCASDWCPQCLRLPDATHAAARTSTSTGAGAIAARTAGSAGELCAQDDQRRRESLHSGARGRRVLLRPRTLQDRRARAVWTRQLPPGSERLKPALRRGGRHRAAVHHAGRQVPHRHRRGRCRGRHLRQVQPGPAVPAHQRHRFQPQRLRDWGARARRDNDHGWRRPDHQAVHCRQSIPAVFTGAPCGS